MPLTRDDVLEIADMELPKFQSRQRRSQVPFEADRRDSELVGRIFGYELRHAFGLALANLLTNSALDPSEAKDVVEEARMFLPEVATSLFDKSGELWVLLTNHSGGKKLQFSKTLAEALKAAAALHESRGDVQIESFSVFDMTGVMKRAETVLRRSGREDHNLWRNQDRVLKVR